MTCKCICAALVALGHAVGATSVDALEVPKVVTIIVPYPAGGLGDIMPRAVADAVTARSGRTFGIDNRPGATQMLGTRAAAGARPDGSTILFGSATSLAVNPAVKKSLPYDPVKDFAPISLVFVSPMYLVVRRDLPVATVPELLALARRQPAKLTYASGGVGSASHLAGELLKTRAGIDMIHGPYAGTGPAVRDVIGGHVDLTFTGSGVSHAEQVKVVAVTSAVRAEAAATVPAIHETIPGYDATPWFGFLAPAGTPRAIVDQLAAEIRETVTSGALAARMKASGNEIELRGSTPDEFRAFIAREIPQWKAVVEAAGIPRE
ncbi:MAG: tripartite tricarboxylate transporter substrate binding protein [Hyphomicrobiales bacterium]|nr:tripartite tricarboxylate transporter substrate binding protein [Hyphomicrobiales bacterium]